jgi:predicted ATPase
MKIKQLDIKGFRSLKDVSWRPGDLNVVIGQNGTGKSNLLRMLELISASAQGKLAKYIQAIGGLDPILWDGRASSISFHLKMDGLLVPLRPEFLPPPAPGFLPGELASETQVIPNDYKVELAGLVNTGWYRINRESLTNGAFLPEDQEQTLTKYIERNDNSQSVLGGIEAIWGDDSSQETLLSTVTQSMASKPHLQYLQTVWFRKRLAEIFVYHDLNVGQDSPIRRANIARFEKQVEPDGQNLTSVLHTLYTGDREFKRNLDAAMRAAFGDDFEELVFPPAADQRIQLRVRWNSLRREQSADGLSDGTLRFLFLLTVLTAPNPPMVIAIDEPETGLHPRMLPIVAEYATEAASQAQIIFSTHSPQFLDAFTETCPTTTVANWENGETSLHILAGEELNYWLADYSLGSLFESGELEAMI